jgi:hypothetical protein
MDAAKKAAEDAAKTVSDAAASTAGGFWGFA